MTAVPFPLFISARLMAAFKVDGAGTLHLHAEGRTDEGRVQYRYVVEDADGVVLETGDDLHSGVGAEPDYLRTMGSLVGFLMHAAESGDDGDPGSFNAATTQWARQHSDELSLASCDLDTDPDDHPSNCTECAKGVTAPHAPVWATT